MPGFSCKIFTPGGQLEQDADFASIAARWTRLATLGNQADPFSCGPVWQLSFQQAMSPNRPIVLVENGTSLLALAQLTSDKGQVWFTSIEAHWFFANPLLGPCAVQLFIEAQPQLAALCAPARPCFALGGMVDQGKDAFSLLRHFSPTHKILLHSESTPCAASLEGGLDGYLSRRSANTRANLRKAQRKARAHRISFERHNPASADEAAAIYERMLAVEAKSWKGIGQCGMLESPPREFYGTMIARLAAHRAARVILARQNGEDVGFIFGGISAGYFRGQQFSYAERCKALSLGNLMQVEMIAWLAEDGVGRYDMGPCTGPRMDYKKHWTEIELPIQTWLFVPRD